MRMMVKIKSDEESSSEFDDICEDGKNHEEDDQEE